MREFLGRPTQREANMGSFDCVAVREANSGFAQDDHLI